MLSNKIPSNNFTFFKIINLCLIFLFPFQLNAQIDSTQVFKKKLNISENTLAISANLGSAGFGLMLHCKINDMFGLKFGGTFGDFNIAYQTIYKGSYTKVNSEFNLMMLDLLLDFYPLQHKKFHITSGFSMNENFYSADVKFVKFQSFGLINYSPDQIGYLYFSAKGLKFSPYLGIGFDKTVPTHKIGIGFDLGAFYIGPPKFIINANGSLSPSNTVENKQIVERAFRKFQFFPFINFQLKYKIK